MKSSLSPLLIYGGLISLKPARPCCTAFLVDWSPVSKTVAGRPCSTLLFTRFETADEEQTKEERDGEGGEVVLV